IGFPFNEEWNPRIMSRQEGPSLRERPDRRQALNVEFPAPSCSVEVRRAALSSASRLRRNLNPRRHALERGP
ncbi:MAG: hypothetical protein ACHQ4J_15750, partial [Candidatus Binatia bacterium]